MGIIEFLDEQIKMHQAAIDGTKNATDQLVAALESMYRRQQLLGALTTLVQLRKAIATEQSQSAEQQSGE